MELRELNNNKKIQLQDGHKHFSKEGIQMAVSHILKTSASGQCEPKQQ